MTEESIKSKFQELNMTRDEIERFSEAMKKEEFRKLLVEYAEEISDPKNRELYEKEITMLEEERGQNVIFIHPEAGFCMKTIQNGAKKCFINICKNKNIEKPTSKRQTRQLNEKKSEGLVWYIPHTCSPPRDDLDKSGKIECIVYDVVFNPDSYRMAETNERFKNLLKNSAMDTIESNFNVKLDRANVKILKNLNFKGRPTATILRKQADTNNTSKSNQNSTSDDLIKPLIDQIKENQLDKELAKKLESNKKQNEKPIESKEINESPTHTTPKYKIVHRGLSDMSDYATDLNRYVVASTRPKELVIDIELPLCKSSQNVILDVFETHLHLDSKEPNYLLDLNLPFAVREKEARAKFDKSKRCLSVTVPVVPYITKVSGDHDNQRDLSPSPSTVSTTSTSSLESTTTSTSNELNSITNTTTTDQIISDSLIKYNLPDELKLSESLKFICFKFKIINYVKETFEFELNTNDEISLNFKCESCSKHGSYIKYYSACVKLITSDMKLSSEKLVSYIDEDWFEIRFIKLNSVACQQAQISLNTHSLESKQCSIETIENDKILNELNLNLTANMNKMSKKEFIFNFKTNAEKNNSLDDDDDDVDDTNGIIKEDLEDTKYIDQYSKTQIKTENIVMKGKILEEPEQLDDMSEKDYLKKQSSQLNDTDQEEEDDDEENENEEDESKKEMSLSSSSTNFSNDSNSLTNRLKSILKKPRSYSESESNLAASLSQRLSFGGGISSDCASNSESLNDMSTIKKSVSFNKQVVRNVFKPGSTVMGMRKPNSKKNQKKNQKRKRTISDPSHDASSGVKHDTDVSNLRPRNLSESSDDNSSQLSSSSSSVQFVLSDDNEVEIEEKSIQTKKSNQSTVATTTTTTTNTTTTTTTTSKKKKNKKKKANKSHDENNNKLETSPVQSTTTDEVKNPLNLETMISWKNEGRLPADAENPNKTNCSFKFKNKIINDLDD